MKRIIAAFMVLMIMGTTVWAQKEDERRDRRGDYTYDELQALRKDKLRTELYPGGSRGVMQVAPLVGLAMLQKGYDYYYGSSLYNAWSTNVTYNSMFGTEGYSSLWSTWNTYKALYVFDVSSLSAGNYALEMEATQSNTAAVHLSVYDAEDFNLQKAGPYSGSDAILAHTGTGTILETIDFPNTTSTLTFNGVSAAVNDDITGGGGLTGFVLDIDEPASMSSLYTWTLVDGRLVEGASAIPTLGQYGLAGLIGLLLAACIFVMRRNR